MQNIKDNILKLISRIEREVEKLKLENNMVGPLITGGILGLISAIIICGLFGILNNPFFTMAVIIISGAGYLFYTTKELDDDGLNKDQ